MEMGIFVHGLKNNTPRFPIAHRELLIHSTLRARKDLLPLAFGDPPPAARDKLKTPESCPRKKAGKADLPQIITLR